MRQLVNVTVTEQPNWFNRKLQFEFTSAPTMVPLLPGRSVACQTPTAHRSSYFFIQPAI